MSEVVQKEQWVWVVVQDPGDNEQFLGQQDRERNESFIPVFLEKEEAQQGLSHLVRGEGHTYEVQAIRFDDLEQRAAEHGFLLVVLSGSGTVLERITP